MRRIEPAAGKQSSPRVLLRPVLQRLRREPHNFLPERSVGMISQFFSGYSILGGPVWQELVRFESWLTRKFHWPLDIGKWDRFICLNSADGYDSYMSFFKLYSQFVREVPDEPLEPLDPRFELDASKFDFYQLLYCISRRPGMYLGADGSVNSLAAFLAGYFAGKFDSGSKLSRDEKQFLRFEPWMCRTYKFKRRYPWYRLVELWPRNSNSATSFFDEFDAFLTDFGKKPRGLEDLFEVVKDDWSTRFQRKGRIAKPVVPAPESGRWWRQGSRKS